MTDTVPEFLITRRFAAPIEQVFDAWADPEKMVEWSGPTGSKAEIVEGRIAEGEHSISRSTGEGYPEMYSLMVWREIRPPSRIAMSCSRVTASMKRRRTVSTWPGALSTTLS